MKKIFALLTAMCLTISMFAGCEAIKNLPGESAAPSAPVLPSPSGELKLPEASPLPSEEGGETASTLATSGKPCNSSGNIQSGGFVVQDGSKLFYVKNSAIWSKNGDKPAQKIYSGVSRKANQTANGTAATVKSLNFWNGRLYFVAETGKTSAYTGSGFGDPLVYECVYSCAPDGSGLKQELAEAPTGGSLYVETSAGNTATFDFNSAYCSAYSGFTIIDGYMYFIGSSKTAVPSSYLSSPAAAASSIPPVKVSYSRPLQLIRHKIGGNSDEIIVADLGNRPTYFSTDGSKLCYAIALFNPSYSAYDHVAIFTCSLDGKNQNCIFGAPPDMPTMDEFTTERTGGTAIIQGMQLVGDKVFLSLRDSEGDFPDGTLDGISATKYNQSFTELLVEGARVKALVTDNSCYYFTLNRNENSLLSNISLVSLGFGSANETSLINPSPAGGEIYYLTYEINVCGNSVFCRDRFAPGGETLFAVNTDGSNFRQF
ncbi:MAG: hypothetical protein RR032_02840 [Oscillospiraceae bacterium]